MQSGPKNFLPFEKGFDPLLPKVTPDTVNALSREFADRPNLLSDVYGRLLSEQFPLTDQVAKYIVDRAVDPTEATKMTEVFALTYRLLEAQKEADGLPGLFE